MRLVPNHCAVLEFNPFSTLDNEVNRVHVSLGREGTVAPPSVEIVWPLLHHVGHWRVMRHLLHVDLSAVIVHALVSLTEHWVQRLVESVARVQERQRARHDELHTLDRIGCHRSCGHVSWGVNRHRGNHVQE